ncbi:MAG: sulfate permease, SulP family [Campylobacterota bacterium]|nr:sulfate permease, SulP family [Campylobacterota bacterium]
MGGMAGCAMIGQSVINIKSGGRGRLSTHNLALGVFSGVLLASLFFANKISHLMYWGKSYEKERDARIYKFVGQIFFNSADRFADAFDYKEEVKRVVIDVTHAHFWDISAVYALDKAVIKLRNTGKNVEVVGQNEATQTIIDRFGIHDKPEEIEKMMGAGH